MYISSVGSRSRLLIAIRGIDIEFQFEVLTLNFRREINEKQWAFQQTTIKHHRIVIANVGL